LLPLPGFERDLKEMQKNLTEAPPTLPAPDLPPITQAIMGGMQKYTAIGVPALAIYAMPHASGQPYKDDAARVAAEARDEANTGAQAKAFESGVPSGRVFACRTRIITCSSRMKRMSCAR